MKLAYRGGAILVYGECGVPNARWDERSKCYRAQAFYYRDIKDYLKESGISFKDSFLNLLSSPYLRSRSS